MYALITGTLAQRHLAGTWQRLILATATLATLAFILYTLGAPTYYGG